MVSFFKWLVLLDILDDFVFLLRKYSNLKVFQGFVGVLLIKSCKKVQFDGRKLYLKIKEVGSRD